MLPKSIGLLRRRSKVELDSLSGNFTDFELAQHYEQLGFTAAKIDRIFQSHTRQQAAFAKLCSLLGREIKHIPWLLPEEADDDFETAHEADWLLRNCPLVIALGGDETFKFAAQFRTDGLILGLNPDPGPSKGKLLSGTVDDFERNIEQFWRDELRVVERIRLGAELNGIDIGLASDQIFLGKGDREAMSRYIIQTPDGRSEEQKSSGLLVATGSGSTGWYRSERGSSRFDFPRELNEARFYVTAPIRNDDDSTFELTEGSILPGESLVVRSLCHPTGRISLDGYPHRDDEDRETFGEGAEARIFISDSPLRVLSLS